MNRRILAAVLALGLALVGTVVLVSYVRAADERALAGVETTPVLVVTRPIPQGTPADELAESVRLEQLPATVTATGTVRDLDDLGDRVATVALQPGEQVLASRFADASTLFLAGTVAVPPGDQEVSIMLEPQRPSVAGWRPATTSASSSPWSSRTRAASGSAPPTPPSTACWSPRCRAPSPSPPRTATTWSTASSGAAVPSESLLITLALPAGDAEKVVFGMEHGTVWLSLEPEGADNSGTGIITQGNVYGDAPITLGNVYGGSEK